MKPERIDLVASPHIALIGRGWPFGSEKSKSWLEANSDFTVELSRGKKRSVTVHKETTGQEVMWRAAQRRLEARNVAVT
jgi:hypothetical protein